MTTAASGCLDELALDAYEAAMQTPESPEAMSNFDHTVDDGMEAALHRGERSTHAAWDFNGLVVFRDGAYIEWVRRYNSVVCRHTAPSLKELMEDVNDAHGSD